MTDVILCSKIKAAPSGFQLAGDINGIAVCFKTTRVPPPIPTIDQSINALENSLYYVNISANANEHAANKSKPTVDDDYEIIQTSYQSIVPPPRLPRKSSAPLVLRPSGTLPLHNEMEGVPFIFNARIATNSSDPFDVSKVICAWIVPDKIYSIQNIFISFRSEVSTSRIGQRATITIFNWNVRYCVRPNRQIRKIHFLRAEQREREREQFLSFIIK